MIFIPIAIVCYKMYQAKWKESDVSADETEGSDAAAESGETISFLADSDASDTCRIAANDAPSDGPAVSNCDAKWTTRRLCHLVVGRERYETIDRRINVESCAPTRLQIASFALT